MCLITRPGSPRSSLQSTSRVDVQHVLPLHAPNEQKARGKGRDVTSWHKYEAQDTATCAGRPLLRLTVRKGAAPSGQASLYVYNSPAIPRQQPSSCPHQAVTKPAHLLVGLAGGAEPARCTMVVHNGWPMVQDAWLANGGCHVLFRTLHGLVGASSSSISRQVCLWVGH
jgi:hypothetical protein